MLARFFGDLIATLMWRAFEAMRAAAIALYVVFVVLALLAMQRGLRVGGVLFGVSIVFALLVRTNWYEPGTKWFSCRAAGRVAACVTTKRLLHTTPPRDPANPWGARLSGKDQKGSAP